MNKVIKVDANMVATAWEIAWEVHTGAFRRDGVTPYMRHVEKVRAIVAGDLVLEVVALLHDVMEESKGKVGVEILVARGIARELAETVAKLTRAPGRSYTDYIMELLDNPIAVRVKTADMVANLMDEPLKHQIYKYGLHLPILIAALGRE